MHARTGYEDWPEPERRRDLSRLWIVIPEELGLPEVFADSGIGLPVASNKPRTNHMERKNST